MELDHFIGSHWTRSVRWDPNEFLKSHFLVGSEQAKSEFGFAKRQKAEKLCSDPSFWCALPSGLMSDNFLVATLLYGRHETPSQKEFTKRPRVTYELLIHRPDVKQSQCHDKRLCFPFILHIMPKR